MNLRASAASLAIVSAFAAPAIADGLQEPVVVAPTPVVETAPAPYVSPFTGGYAGAQLGYGYGDTDFSENDADEDEDGFIDRTDDAIDSIGEDGDGVIGGVHGGFLANANRFIYGGEVEYNRSDISFDDDGGDVENLTNLKAKAGYDFGRTLVYATGGATYGTAEITDSDFEDWGYNAGLGVDRFVTDNITVGAEALYTDFGEFDDSDLDVSLATVAARLSYHF